MLRAVVTASVRVSGHLAAPTRLRPRPGLWLHLAGGLGLALVALSSASCSEANLAYCDAVTPCADLDRPFCDLTGAYQASGGIRYSCIPEPRCHEGSCDSEAPVCDLEREECAGCASDDDCAAFADTPVCAADGACVGCLVNRDCPSDACHPVTHECAAEEGVLYLDRSVEEGDCSRASPCPDLSQALALLSSDRFTLRMAPGGYQSSVSVAPGQLVILADTNAILTPGPAADQMVRVEAGADVLLHGLSVNGTNGSEGMDAIGCLGSPEVATRLQLLNVRATRAPRNGIKALDCEVSIAGSTIAANGALGVEATEGRLDLVRSRISENAGGGMLVSGTALVFRNNFVGANGSKGGLGAGLLASLPEGSHFEHNTVVGNQGGVQCLGGVTLANSILYGNAGEAQPDEEAEEARGCSLRYSIVGPVAQPGTGNLNLEPVFLSPASIDDFHLDPSSPGVDQAEDSEVVEDIDGEVRPQGEAPDVGADEVGASATTRSRPARRRRIRKIAHAINMLRGVRPLQGALSR